MRKPLYVLVVGLLLAGIVAGCSPATPEPTAASPEPTTAAEPTAEAPQPPQAQEWKIVNPEGVVAVDPIEIAPRLASLEDKTVLLRWNGKPNGDVVLNRIAELLASEVPSAKVIKLYEEDPLSGDYSKTQAAAAAEMKAVVEKYKPDLVIASQAD